MCPTFNLLPLRQFFSLFRWTQNFSQISSLLFFLAIFIEHCFDLILLLNYFVKHESEQLLWFMCIFSKYYPLHVHYQPIWYNYPIYRSQFMPSSLVVCPYIFSELINQDYVTFFHTILHKKVVKIINLNPTKYECWANWKCTWLLIQHCNLPTFVS